MSTSLLTLRPPHCLQSVSCDPLSLTDTFVGWPLTDVKWLQARRRKATLENSIGEVMDNLKAPVSCTWQTIGRGKPFMRDHLLNMAFAASRAMKQQQAQGNCQVHPSPPLVAWLSQSGSSNSLGTRHLSSLSHPGILLTHPWGDKNIR